MELKNIEAHMHQIEGFFAAIVAGTFPGAHAENISGMKKYFQEVHSQLSKAKEEILSKQKVEMASVEPKEVQ